VARTRLYDVLRHIQGLASASQLAAASDGELVARFAAGGEEAAFAALLRRHGPLVLAVCRHILGQEQDAEDAFQATFLLLARKAGSIRKKASVASWLHGVAYRLSVRTKAQRARWQANERRAASMRKTGPDLEAALREVQAALDGALEALPERYRAALVLCHLEGKSHLEACRALGCPLATLRSRLTRGRKLLRDHLVGRALSLPAGALAAVLVLGGDVRAVPGRLVGATLQAALRFAAGQAATGLVSANAAALAKGALRIMWMQKLVATALVLGGLVVAGALALPGLVAGAIEPSGRQAPEGRPPALLGRAGAPAPAPVEQLLKASGEVRKLRSAAGMAVFEGYALEGEEKAGPHTKGKVSVYFDGGKYHLRYQYDYRQRQTLPAKAGGGKKVAEMTPDDVAVICDGAVTQEVIYSAFWFRPAGCQVNLRDRLRNASWGICLDHPAELWREVLDVDALVKDVGRDALTLTRLESGTIRGSYRLMNAPKVRVEFEARPADGYNVSSLRVFNDGETRAAQTARATWARASGAWYVKELVTELDGRRPAGGGKLNRLVFRYESFEPGAKVDPKLFTLDCLAIPTNARTLDQRQGRPR
jgi:RNA polymerase sigma factor (sigma-70 family)